MPQKQFVSQQSIAYFFLRSKDIHEENNSISITLFGRLSREITYSDSLKVYNQTETMWVDIEEVPMEQAAEKIKKLPNCICRYEITEEVFRDLYEISKTKPKELYSLTPLHTFKKSR